MQIKTLTYFVRFLFLAIFLLLQNVVQAEELRLAAESESTLTVAGCVNVMNGDFFRVDSDIVIDGPQSLSYTRFYDSGDHSDDFFFYNHYGYGVSLAYPLIIEHFCEAEKHFITLDQRQRFPLPFKLKEEFKELRGRFDKKVLKSGYTNCTEALLRGEPSSVHTNIFVDLRDPLYAQKWNVYLSEGTKRVYLHTGKSVGTTWADRKLLWREDHPNGLSTHYLYDHSFRLYSVSLKNALGEELSSIQIRHINDTDYTVSGSNGLSAFYHTEFLKGKIARRSSKAELREFFLTHASGAHLTSQENEFPVGKQANTLLYFGKIKSPNGRHLGVKYDSNGRVNELLAPLGFDETSLSFYKFKYKKKATHVTNALGRVDTYRFSHRRLKSKKEGGERTFVYDWSSKGQLRSKSLRDKENALEAILFRYNDTGNITEKIVCGNITGFGDETFRLKEDKVIGNPDQRIHSYKYGNKSLLLEEKDPSGLIIRYRYKPGTNLPSSKRTVANDKIAERSFYTYDQNAILRETIEDDGSMEDASNLSGVTYRLITRIEPQMDKALHGFTKPKVKETLYLDLATGEERLLKRVEKDYANGGLIAEKRVYDSTGALAYFTSYTYDERFLLREKKNPLGQITRYSFDENRNVIFEELVGSRKQLHKSYDCRDRVVKEKEIHEDGTILLTMHTYDLTGNRTSTTDHEGFTTKFIYDQFGRCIQKIDPDGCVTQTAYDLKDNPVSVTDKEGHTTKTSYTIDHHPIEIAYPDGTSERFRYFIDGSLQTKWEKDETSVHYTYDHQKRVLSETRRDSKGNQLATRTYVYKGKNLLAEVDANGVTTTYDYDGAGRKIAKTRAGIKETYDYDALGRLSKTTKGNSVFIQLFDALDRVVEERTEDLSGQFFSKKTTLYDIYGNASIQRAYIDSSQYIETSTLYNSQNLPVQEIDGEGNRTTFSYTHSPFTKTTTDSLGQQVREIYGCLNRLETRETTFSGTLLAKNTYDYSPNGQKMRQTNARIESGSILGSSVIEWSYDPSGNILSQTEQGKKSTNYEYLNGRLHTTTKPDGIILEQVYDALGRIYTLSSSDKTIRYAYEYDLNDNLLKVIDLNMNVFVERSYDAHNRLVHEKQATGIAFDFSYDPHDRLSEISWQDNKIVYEYSPLALVSASRYKGDQEIYRYNQTVDGRGKVVSRILPNGTQIDYTWDNAERCTRIESVHFHQYLFYDSVGNLIAMTENDTYSTFSYDPLYQLIAESGRFSNQYTFDSLNNRRSKSGVSQEVDELNQLLKDSEHAYEYDLNGNRTSKGNTRYLYDALGRLIAFSDGDVNISYKYDPLGRCYERQEVDTIIQYIYQFDTEIGALENGQTKELRAIHGQFSSFAFELNNSFCFPIRNHRGDTSMLLDEKGEPVSVYRYNAFGESIHDGSKESPWLFSGQRFDASTGLYAYAKRNYDPATGRWLTPDPLGFADGSNLYAYVHNNPLIYIDPYGLSTFSINQFCQGFGRGFLDDTTWGASSYALGEYECNDWASRFGYGVGTAASLGAGLYYGGTEAKIIGGIGKGICKAAKYSKSAIKGAKTTKNLAETHKVTKLISEGGSTIQKVSRSSQSIKPSKELSLYVPKSAIDGQPLALPRNPYGANIPSSQSPHTQLGWRNGRNGGYRQTREWSYDGKEIKTTDWTDHGRPEIHPYPHDHYHFPNSTGGTSSRGKGVPFKYPDE